MARRKCKVREREDETSDDHGKTLQIKLSKSFQEETRKGGIFLHFNDHDRPTIGSDTSVTSPLPSRRRRTNRLIT